MYSFEEFMRSESFGQCSVFCKADQEVETEEFSRLVKFSHQEKSSSTIYSSFDSSDDR